MKTYYVLAFFLVSTTMFGMEQTMTQSATAGAREQLPFDEIMLLPKAEKQTLLLTVIDHYKSTDKINSEALKRFLNEVEINYQCPAFSNQTALIRAIARGNPGVIKEVLSTPGLDVNITTLSYDAAAHVATCSPAVLKLLIENKTSVTPQLDLNQRGTKGTTPLYAACRSSNVDAVRLLCAEPEVDPNIPTGEDAGNYPLHEAVRGVERETVAGMDCPELLIIRALADKGAFIECENKKMETPFLLAFKRLRDNRFIAYNRLIAVLALGAQKKQIITRLANDYIRDLPDRVDTIEKLIQGFA